MARSYVGHQLTRYEDFVRVLDKNRRILFSVCATHDCGDITEVDVVAGVHSSASFTPHELARILGRVVRAKNQRDREREAK